VRQDKFQRQGAPEAAATPCNYQTDESTAGCTSPLLLQVQLTC